ncbi:hypothetical protein FOA52_008904 [Chlamydomonas sp. UWO 241]|nr:hypothetical protein FOA52_008904 [Chlamydomonas sp. UWO 241]
MSRNANKTLELSSSLRARQGGHDGDTSMTLPKLIAICTESGTGPRTPAAVTRLELNCQLFSDISPDISIFSACDQLVLSQNKIRVIENFGALTELRCLYLQHNLITRIEGLDTLLCLRVLDLSNNAISMLEGLAGLPSLDTLLVASNRLGSVNSLSHLVECNRISYVDAGHNQISDPEVLRVFAAMHSLETLTLHYNPLSNASDPSNTAKPILPHYRRTVISMCSGLTAVDHKPVFPQERKYAEAWWAAGRASSGECSSPADSPRGGDGGDSQRPTQLPAPGCKEGDRGTCGSDGGGSVPWHGRGRSAATHPAGATGVHGIAGSSEHEGDKGTPSAALGSTLDVHVGGGGGGNGLPTALLHPVLGCLPPRALVMAALTCRWWARLAGERLQEERTRTARARWAASEAAWPDAMRALTGVRHSSLQVLRVFASPPRPLAQLFWALTLVWGARRVEQEGSAGRVLMGGGGEVGGPPAAVAQGVEGAGEGAGGAGVTGDEGTGRAGMGGGEGARGAGMAGASEGTCGADVAGGAGEDAALGVETVGKGAGGATMAGLALAGGADGVQECSSVSAAAAGHALAGGGADGAKECSSSSSSSAQQPALSAARSSRKEGSAAAAAGSDSNNSAAGSMPCGVGGDGGPGVGGGGQAADARAAPMQEGGGEIENVVVRAEGGGGVHAAGDGGDDAESEDFSWVVDHHGGALPGPGPGEYTLHHASGDGAASCGGDEEDEPEEYRQHFDSPTWVDQVWMPCLAMLSDPSFPGGLADALPLSARLVVRLRARTGAADDLEVYTPELIEADVSRVAPVVAPLCRWLLAAQERETARALLADAAAWDWPDRVLAKLMEAAGVEAGAG